MKEHFKGFYQYCKGYTLQQIADSQGVKINTVKSWMNRYNWAAKKEECRDANGEIDFLKVKGFTYGKGNLEPVKTSGHQFESQKTLNTRLQENTPVNNECKQYIREVLTHTTRYYTIARATTYEEMDIRIQEYFQVCINDGMIPTVEGLWLCLGMQKDTFLEIARGKMGNRSAELLKNARLCVQQCTTQLALGGKIDKILYIFLSKNHFDLHDKTEHEVSHIDHLGVQDSKEAIEQRLGSRLQETVEPSIIDVDCDDADDDYNNHI